MDFEKTKNESEEEFSQAVLDFLKSKHDELSAELVQNNYDLPGNCGPIAQEVARILISEGGKPYISVVTQRVGVGESQEIGELKPVIFENKDIKWEAHIVCCCGETVLDPLLGRPVSLQEYPKVMFGKGFVMKELVPSEKMDEFLAAGSASQKADFLFEK